MKDPVTYLICPQTVKAVKALNRNKPLLTLCHEQRQRDFLSLSMTTHMLVRMTILFDLEQHLDDSSSPRTSNCMTELVGVVTKTQAEGFVRNLNSNNHQVTLNDQNAVNH